MRNRENAQRILNTRCHLFRHFCRTLKQDHDKLLTAIARHYIIGCAYRLFQRLRNASQAFVSRLVSVGIVVELEIIDVEHDQRKGFLLADGVFQEAFHRPTIGRFGQGILVRQGVQARNQHLILLIALPGFVKPA
ncbi:hypothetical protein D3C80_982940 [compost metagenome]